jgi:malonyl-CoA O-methyltransferase
MKEKIARKFSQASQSYEDAAFVQKQCAKILVEQLIAKNINPETILDLGTGTGQIPTLLLKNYPDASYTLNDISPTMISKVEEKFKAYNKFSFHIGDMETCNFKNHDLIVSNFAMQWSDNLRQVIEKHLKLCKTMAFSFLLKGTFYEWSNILQNYAISSIIDKYPEEENIKEFINSISKADCLRQDFQLRFANVKEFILYLKKLGATSNNNQISPAIIRDIIKKYDQEFLVTYKVFFCTI